MLAGIGALIAVTCARADDNDQILGAIDVFCANPRGSIRDTAKLVMTSPFQTRDFGAVKKPEYFQQFYLTKLGASLALRAKSAARPVSECEFVGYSDDMAALAPRLRAVFDLPEPQVREIDSIRVTSRKSAGSRSVNLEYGLQDNQKAGAFTLTVKR